MKSLQLPNATSATVADAKVRDYLLDPNHPGNGGKATFFQRFGFNQSAWSLLKAALLDHPLNNPASITAISPWGVTFDVRCNLQSPDGRNLCIQSVWIVEPISPDPQFVTAYPVVPSGLWQRPYHNWRQRRHNQVAQKLPAVPPTPLPR